MAELDKLPDPLAPVPPVPTSSSKLAKQSKRYKTLMFVAIGVGVVLLILTIYFAIRASSSAATLSAQYQNGVKDGATAQRKDDIKEFTNQQNEDLRVYTAPEEFGSFEVGLPKSWSWAITPSSQNGTFLGISDPSYVDTTAAGHAFKLELVKESYDKRKKNLDDQVKTAKGGAQSSEVTVSGIKGTKYVGPTDSKTKLKPEVVIVPLREKTMVFSTSDSATYGEAFDTILKNIKLNP